METDLTSSTAPITSRTGTALPLAAIAIGETGDACVRQAGFDGLAWTFRAGFDRVLASVSAAAWSRPQDQGWQCIKSNGPRDVWRVTIGGVVYYLKYYIPSGWTDTLKSLFRRSACRSEWDGGIYALNAGIAAVRPAAYAAKLRRDGRRCSLLVTEAVEPGYPLNDFWQAIASDPDPARRRQDAAQLIDLLAEMIARAHQAGFEHLDMHAANILVQPVGLRRYRTAFVDLQSSRLGVPISDRAVVGNLAQLNQWFHKNSSVKDRLRFLRAYFRWRNEYEQTFEHARPLELTFDQLVRALIDAADRHAQRLGAQRDRRIHRDGRYFSAIRLRGGWRAKVFLRCKQKSEESRASAMVFGKDWWREQLQDPLRWFGPPDAQTCKDSHSARVARAILPGDQEGLPVVIKRPLARSGRRRLSQLLAPSRSARGWQMGHALLHRDIAVARPLAVAERRLGPLVLDSLLITELIPGAADLETHLRREYAARSPRAWFQHKRALCEHLVRHLRRLQDRGFAHRDCKAGNILVVPCPRLKLLWIDMDGLRLVKRLSRRQWLAPLVRLHVSLCGAPGLTRTDRLRFLKSYFARFGSDPDEWRAAWPELAGAVEKKLRAKQVRRAWKLTHYGRE